MPEDHLIVGLGNPGREYAATRHNAGFMVVEGMGSGWREEPRLKSRITRVELKGKRVWLCQPVTFMNVSGEAVRAIMDFYKIGIAQVMVTVDDADLALGRIRMRSGGGSSGGHHGLDSIEKFLGTRDFARQRVGIGRLDGGTRDIAGYVLGRFGPDEQAVLSQVLDRARKQLECWLEHGVQRAMNQFNGAVDASEKKDNE